MPRIKRIDTEGFIYHVLNRANARMQIFDDFKDYQLFEAILEEAKERFDVNVLSYSIMPNHWHLVLIPKKDGELQKFMGWLTNTHTRRWHTLKNTIGQGHLYQGRYKSFICQDDDHFLTLVRYVERNPKKANLVKRAEDWRWGSLWRIENGTIEQKELISEWPVFKPENYLNWLEQPQTEEEEEHMKKSLERGSPYGDNNWTMKMIKTFNCN